MTRLPFLLVAACVASPVLAQDLIPALDPAQIAHGQVLSSMVLAHGESAARRPRPTRAQVQACAMRPRFRREMGATHPKVLRLDRSCRGVGL